MPRRPTIVVGMILIAAVLAIGAILAIGRTAAGSFPGRAELGEFAAGHRDTVTINRSHLRPAQLELLDKTPLTGRVSVADLTLPLSDAAATMVIRRPVVLLLDKLIGEIASAHPNSLLTKSMSTHSADRDREIGGTGSGPHVRGDALDVAFQIPGMSSRASAVYVAGLAHRLGVKGIAVLRGETGYSVHLDPVRADPWYVEQSWQQVETPSGKRWLVYYQGIDPSGWANTDRSAPADQNDIVGDWLSSTVVSGKTIPNGSTLMKPTHVNVFRKPNGHYGLRILNDTIPEVTALWDATREGPDKYTIHYDWKQSPPAKGVEQFRGTLQMIRGEVLRTTTQTNPAYPGEVTTVSAHWTRLSRGQSGPDPEISFLNGVVRSHGFPANGSDTTASGGQYIDRTLLDQQAYRESAPSFVPR